MGRLANGYNGGMAAGREANGYWGGAAVGRLANGGLYGAAMGVQVNGYNYGAAMGFPVTLHWEFYFSEKWSAYAEAGVNVVLPHSLFQGDGYNPKNPGAWIMGSVGGLFHINKAMALVLNVGNPYSSFGVLFKF